MIDDLMDEPEHDQGPETPCSICHNPTAFESCGFCGNPICPACFEMGGGFCNQPHTQEQIDAYAKDIYEPPRSH